MMVAVSDYGKDSHHSQKWYRTSSEIQVNTMNNEGMASNHLLHAAMLLEWE
jgi:hypothetical protein